jgi:Zn ribbon nucleic-acid-binding protein
MKDKIDKCPDCGETENLHYNYDWAKAHAPILEIICNECGHNFTPTSNQNDQEKKD